MFKFANAISLISAGVKPGGLLLADSAVSGMPDIQNRSIFQNLDGSFWLNLLIAIGNAFFTLIYLIVRCILNVVDFLQYFCKHLIGLDYWEKGDVRLDTLGESDIIFKFIYDKNVQRVFKYMLGLFVVLLILFAIIAIVKNQYAVASDSKDADNNPMAVMKRCFKAIFLVVLVPVMLVMGILASNAVLAGLVNALNVNNRLTLGGQVFASSAYDANRYRKYAENDIRYSVTNSVNVKVGENVKKIATTVTPIIPKDFNEGNKFTGFAFKYRENWYLYYVPEEECKRDYNYYVKYFNEIMGVEDLATHATFQTEKVGDKKFIIKAALSTYEQKSAINTAAYNTWKYNSIYLNHKATFENTLDAKVEGFTADSGHNYASARVYTNNKVWGAMHDGGANGLVALKDEYLVMADVIDFAITDVVEIGYVNAGNSNIDWSYGNANEGGYLDSKYIKSNLGSGSGTISYVNSFVVNYKQSGFVKYDVNRNSMKTAESDGVTYIVAYYSAKTGKFIPLVNNKTFEDDYGDSHTFTSENLDPNYNGLIVARGILESTFNNQYGYPTEIDIDWNKTIEGGSTSTTTNKYFNATAKKVDATPVSNSSFSSRTPSSAYVTKEGGVVKTKKQYVVSIDTLPTLKNNGNAIANSLPTSFTYSDENGNSRYVSGITWAYQSYTTNLIGKDCIVLKSNVSLKKSVENNDFHDGSADASTKLYDLPLYAFVSLDSSLNAVNIYYVLAEYYNAGSNFFNVSASSTTGLTSSISQASNKLYANYRIGSLASSAENVVGTIVKISALSESTLSIHPTSLTYNVNVDKIGDTDANVLTDYSFRTDAYSYSTARVLQLHKDYDPMIFGFNESQEIRGTRQSSGNEVFYYYLYNSIVYRVRFNTQDFSVSCLTNQSYKFEVDGSNLKVSGVGSGVGAEFSARPYDMSLVGAKEVGGSVIHTYTINVEGISYQFSFKYNVNNGVESYTPYRTNLYRISLSYYNMFVYRVKRGSSVTTHQYNPVTQTDSDTLVVLETKTSYVSEDSIFCKYISQDDNQYIWQITVSNDDSENSLFGTFYTFGDASSVDKVDGINNSYRSVYRRNDLAQIPTYNAGSDVLNQHLKATATIQFKREYIDANQWFADIQINIKLFTGTNDTTRFNIAFLNGFSATQQRTSAFQIRGGALRIDYNFVNSNAPSLELKIFYIPLRINYVILVFAACLMLTILGKAVWGLIQRIFDITLYFIILPGIASMMPLDNGSQFGKWKDNLIKKVFGAYGVMLGLNIFFILCPAIRNVSHLFTADDLATLSEGNILAGVTPGFINSICEVLFTLVALTMIQTLPATISQFIGANGAEDVVKNGEATKAAVKSMTKDVGNTMSGGKVLDFALGEKKDGKRSGGFFNGDLKNFIPGSAVYDEIKSHMKPKKEKSVDQIMQEEAEQRARRDADLKMAEADARVQEAGQTTAPAQNVNATIQNDTIDTEREQDQQADQNAEAQVSDEQAQQFEDSVQDTVRNELENALGGDRDADQNQESEQQPPASNEEDSSDEEKQDIDINVKNSGSVDYAKRAGELVGGTDQDKKEETEQKGEDQEADQNAESQKESSNVENTSETAQESSEVPTSDQIRNASDEEQADMWQKEMADVDNEIDSYKNELSDIKSAKSEWFTNDGEYYGYDEKSTKFVYRDVDREIGKDSNLTAEQKEKLKTEILEYNRTYDELTAEEKGLEKTILERTQYRTEIAELVDDLKAKAVQQAQQEITETVETTVAEKAQEPVQNADTTSADESQEAVSDKPVASDTSDYATRELTLDELKAQLEMAKNDVNAQRFLSEEDRQSAIASLEEKIRQREGASEIAEGEEQTNVEHAQTADVASRVEGEEDQSAVSAERARLYAESAKLSSEASKQYADIAGGRIDKNYGLESRKDRGIEKDRQKLEKLLEKREERIREQEEGNADLKLGILSRKKAYEQFNKDKDVSETIFESNKEAVKKEAIKLWNSKAGNKKLSGTSKDDKELVEKAISEWKDVQALNLYNKKNGTQIEETKDLTKQQLKQARTMLATDQYVKQATARVEFKDNVLDKKISKLQTKVAMKEAGIYEGPLKKALLAMPRAVFSHNMSEKEEDRYRAKMDKWEKVGKESSEKLKDMEKTYNDELKDFTEKNRLVIKNGKIDREETAKNFMKDIDKSDSVAVQKELASRTKQFDKLDADFAKFANKEQYKTERKAELESQLAKAQRRFDVYSAQLQNGKGGFSQVFARELKNGARATKSKLGEIKKQATKDIEAKQLSKEIDKAVKENRQKLGIDWSALKVEGIDVDHENHTYTERQRKALQSKLISITASEAKLRAERTALQNKGGKLDESGNLDKLATAKELMRRSDPAKYKGEISEPDAVKYLNDHISEINKLQSGYVSAKEGIAKAQRSFASTVHRFDIQNEQNFIASGRRLQNATLAKANAEKKRLVDELNTASRSGRLEEGQEAEYIEKINGINQTIDRIKSDPVRFKRAKDKDIRVVKERFGKHGEAESKQPKIRPAKGAKAARQFLASDEKLSERKAKVEYNDSQTAQKVAEKVGREEARKVAQDETSQREYINKVRKALLQSGYAGDVSKIRNTDDARKIRSEIETQLQKASQAKAEEIAKKLREGGKQSELDELKAQEKLINQRLKKIRSVDSAKQMNSSVNIREDIKSASERAVGTAIRNQYKDEWNKFIKSQGMRDVAKSGSSAFDKNIRMQKKLQEENMNLEKRIKALETGGVKADDSRVKTLQEKFDKQEKQIEMLKAMNRKTEAEAKKAMKNFTSINRVMQDMRRQSKYKIKGLDKTSNPTDKDSK